MSGSMMESLTVKEFESLIYESKAGAIDSIMTHFKENGTYDGRIVKGWLASIANEYRKEAQNRR